MTIVNEGHPGIVQQTFATSEVSKKSGKFRVERHGLSFAKGSFGAGSYNRSNLN